MMESGEKRVGEISCQKRLRTVEKRFGKMMENGKNRFGEITSVGYRQ
jgi:hypothetical protein